MRKVLAKNPQIEQQRLHRRVFLENINPENQSLNVRLSFFISPFVSDLIYSELPFFCCHLIFKISVCHDAVCIV